MTAAPTARSPWFLSTRPAPSAPIRLFCLPPAGGGASTFRRWGAALGELVDVRAVALPGREARISERPEIDILAIAHAIRADIDRPYAIFGHSMGGRIGFEVVRELRRRGAELPLALILAASRAPHLVDSQLGGLSGRPDRELLDRLVTLGGVPADVAAEPELLELLLPMLRADFTWLDAYRHVGAEPLPVPVLGFAGMDDTAVSIVDMVGWTAHTRAGVWLDTMPGGHFFPAERLPQLTEAIRAHLTAALSRRRPTQLPSAATMPDPEQVYVYYADTDDLPELAAAHAELSPDERAHANRLAAPAHRSYVAGRVLLRRLLDRYRLAAQSAAPTLPLPAEDWSVAYGSGGVRLGFCQSGRAVLIALACADQLRVTLRATSSVAPEPTVLRLELPVGTGTVALSGSRRRMRFATVGAGDL